jgi:hypothetical protein
LTQWNNSDDPCVLTAEWRSRRVHGSMTEGAANDRITAGTQELGWREEEMSQDHHSPLAGGSPRVVRKRSRERNSGKSTESTTSCITHYRPLEDPAAAEGSGEAILATFRNIRDQIEAQVRGLVRDLA